MNNLLKKDIEKTYEEISKNMTKENINVCTEILTKVINNFSMFIVYNIDLHNKIYNENALYHDFIDAALKNTKSYSKLIKLGNANKSLNKLDSFTTLGLSSLTKKILGGGKTKVEKNFNQSLDNVEIVLESYVDCEKAGLEFCAYFLTLITLNNFFVKNVEEAVESMKF